MHPSSHFGKENKDRLKNYDSDERTRNWALTKRCFATVYKAQDVYIIELLLITPADKVNTELSSI